MGTVLIEAARQTPSQRRALAVVLTRFGPPAPRDRRATADRAIERVLVDERFAVGRVLAERALGLGFDLNFEPAFLVGRVAVRTVVFSLKAGTMMESLIEHPYMSPLCLSSSNALSEWSSARADWAQSKSSCRRS